MISFGSLPIVFSTCSTQSLRMLASRALVSRTSLPPPASPEPWGLLPIQRTPVLMEKQLGSLSESLKGLPLADASGGSGGLRKLQLLSLECTFHSWRLVIGLICTTEEREA